MDKLKFSKVLGAPPTQFIADTIYFVRSLTGFDIYISNKAGTSLFKHNLDDISFERINKNLKSHPLVLTTYNSEGSITEKKYGVTEDTFIIVSYTRNSSGQITQSSILLEGGLLRLNKNFTYKDIIVGTETRSVLSGTSYETVVV
jgi:hypothetical protein